MSENSENSCQCGTSPPELSLTPDNATGTGTIIIKLETPQPPQPPAASNPPPDSSIPPFSVPSPLDPIFLDGILLSVKKLLGIDAAYIHFDADLIMHINSVFSILTQMGVGPASGFSITGYTEKWSDFIADESDTYKLFPQVKSYMYLKVKLMFDPPLSSSVTESINRQISELEWRLYMAAEPIW